MNKLTAPYLYILIAILFLTVLILVLPFTGSKESGDESVLVTPGDEEAPDDKSTIGLLMQAIEAHGGEEAISSIRSVRMSTSSYLGPGEEEDVLEEALYRFPDQMKSLARIGDTTYIQTYDRGTSWVMEGDSLFRGDMRTMEILRRSLKHFPFFLLEAIDSTSLVLAKDRSFVDGEPYHTVYVIDRDSDETTILISPDDFLIRRMDYPIFAGETEEHMRLDFLEYKKSGGVQLPHKVLIYIGGNLVQETKVLTYEMNPELADSLFEFPGPPES